MAKFSGLAAIAGIGVLLTAGAAHATFVPAGTMQLTEDFNSADGAPAVDNTGATIDFSGIIFDFKSGTGGFAGFRGTSTTLTSTISFSEMLGAVVNYAANPINNFLSFSLNNGETYAYSIDQSIQTTGYSFDGQNGTIALYVLGDLTGTGSAGTFASPTPTALTLTLNETGGSGYSLSATLANPPPGSGIPSTPVPEPASMTLMGAGLAALGMIRRRKRK